MPAARTSTPCATRAASPRRRLPYSSFRRTRGGQRGGQGLARGPELEGGRRGVRRLAGAVGAVGGGEERGLHATPPRRRARRCVDFFTPPRGGAGRRRRER